MVIWKLDKFTENSLEQINETPTVYSSGATVLQNRKTNWGSRFVTLKNYTTSTLNPSKCSGDFLGKIIKKPRSDLQFGRDCIKYHFMYFFVFLKSYFAFTFNRLKCLGNSVG